MSEEMPKKSNGGAPAKMRRVQNNVRGFSSTQNDRHPFIEAYCTYTKEEPDELTMSILEGLFLNSANTEMPAQFTDQMMGSIHELVTRLKSTPSMYADAGNVPNVMFHSLDPDILTAMVIRELRVATVQAQGQQMAETDNSEMAYAKHLTTVEFSIKSFLAQGGLSERHPTVVDRALAMLGMLKEAYEKPSHNLPEIIATAVSSIRNRPHLQQALKIAPPDVVDLPTLSLPAFLRYVIPYDAGKMHEFYRPCAMRDVCVFIRPDKGVGNVLPVRNPPLVAFWRPGARSYIDVSLPQLCIFCYCDYINTMSRMGRLRAQDGHFLQVFHVQVGGLTGFPKSYVCMPGMVQEQSRHNGYTGPFPNATILLANLLCTKGAYAFRIPSPTIDPEEEKEEKVILNVPNFS